MSSPTLDAGLADGIADQAAIESCPPQPATRYCEPFPAHPWQYRRGYYAPGHSLAPRGAVGHFTGIGHVCGSQCRRDDER